MTMRLPVLRAGLMVFPPHKRFLADNDLDQTYCSDALGLTKAVARLRLPCWAGHVTLSRMAAASLCHHIESGDMKA